MHGVIGVTNYARNRHGRKRKQRIKLAGGKVVTTVERPVDYRALTAMQPHRRDLPDPFDVRAGTALGLMLLTGQLGPHRFNAFHGTYAPSQEAVRLFQAGLDYARVVRRYLAMISAPQGTAGAGQGVDCQNCPIPQTSDDIKAAYDACKCFRRTKDYNDAIEVLFRAGQRVAKAVARVAVFDEPCQPDYVPLVVIGLRALCKSKETFLTNHADYGRHGNLNR